MNTREERHQNFIKEYEKLNPAQKEAVDATEGPVMVIAGPGTGKTQILATRIANILLKNQINASNILCLTYTDAGAVAMRKRLAEIIGPASYDVGIFTFHSFCNRVISEHPESFELYGDHALADDLDVIEILEKLLKELPSDNPLFSLRENFTNNIRSIRGLIDDIKKENWDPAKLAADLQYKIDHLHEDGDFFYKRSGQGFKKGDINLKKIKETQIKYERTLAAVRLFFAYQKHLEEKNLYDYNDMIQWVIQKFTNNDFLLGEYQERYQYILVDEFQDTNGSQMEIIRLLCSYWESPNIFAVGDDDQAIYRFQGANLRNLTDFITHYEPKLVVLTENYRSSQPILDLAGFSIACNQERLVKVRSGLSKDLTASGMNRNHLDLPVVTRCTDDYSEVHQVCTRIEKLVKEDGLPPGEIAVLFRKNKEAQLYARILESRKIPYRLSKQTNALTEPVIESLISILSFFERENRNPFSADELLGDILHQPYLRISSTDLARVFWSLQKKRNEQSQRSELIFPETSLRLCIADDLFLSQAGVEEPSLFKNLSLVIERLIKELSSCTLQVFLERILYELGILQYVLSSPDREEYLQTINSFYNFVKDVSVKQSQLKIADFLTVVQRMKEHQISIPLTLYTGIAEGVYLSTMHSAKGLEFDTVFIVNQTAGSWSRRNGNQFVLPDEYVKTDSNSDEDDRRLFYVALTRARRNLQISWAQKILGKKEQAPSRFLIEISGKGAETSREYSIGHQDFLGLLADGMSYHHREFRLIDEEHFKRFLENFEMSPTSLEKYLRCPLAFYHETVLRVPGARTASMGFGNAVHYALEKYTKKRSGLSDPVDEPLLRSFMEDGMNKYRSHFTAAEFQRYLAEGIRHLTGFLGEMREEWKEVSSSECEVPFRTKLYRGVPITGKLDRLDILPTGFRVIDYKTGGTSKIREKMHYPDDQYPYGGDYWRQMVFYRILTSTESSRYKNFLGGTFYYVLPDSKGKYHTSQLSPTLEDEEFVGKVLVDSYEKIKKAEFTPGCGKADCTWCRYYNQKNLELSAEEEDDASES